MIPADLAARLRLLTESIVNPVSPVREITGELPELTAGQRFTARIESVLPDGTFRALVAGRSLALALPEAAAPGDTLDLVVTARTPRLILASRADEAAAAPSAPSTLSRAAQLIGALLGSERAPQPALIVGTAPLLPAPPQQAGRLAAALRRAVAESGLFYEAHQAQWIAGRHPAAALAREPQARHAPPRMGPAAAAAQPEAAPPTESARGDEAAAQRGTSGPGFTLPAELRPMVQQQLEALLTQQIVWRGEIWPGQTMEWTIAPDEQQNAADAPATARWTTRLKLTLPRLGEIDVALMLAPDKVSLALTAGQAPLAELRQGLPDLSAAFAAAGLPPLAASVGSHEHA